MTVTIQMTRIVQKLEEDRCCETTALPHLWGHGRVQATDLQDEVFVDGLVELVLTTPAVNEPLEVLLIP